MRAQDRRTLEDGRASLRFDDANPDSSPGAVSTREELRGLVTRGEQVAAQQRDGLLKVEAATADKRAHRQLLETSAVPHLAVAAERAAEEAPELMQKFARLARASTDPAFRTAAGSMAEEAERQKPILAKHGLADGALEGLKAGLAGYDTALAQIADGRRDHVGASAELRTIAREIRRVLRLMDGFNRYRFQHDAEQLAAWESASGIRPRRSRRGHGAGGSGEPGSSTAGGSTTAGSSTAGTPTAPASPAVPTAPTAPTAPSVPVSSTGATDGSTPAQSGNAGGTPPAGTGGNAGSGSQTAA
jgi:hypothetical protein